MHIVGNEPVPAEAREFPLFRAGVADETGRVNTWWLWNGEREWRADLPAQQLQRLPIRGIVNDTLLIERICSGWSSESVPAV